MTRILFLIHDLGQGGAEKVLINLVNNMDRQKFDISVIVLFGGGVNEQFLAKDVFFHSVWKKPIPGNSKLLKIFSPEQLHRMCVKENYDIEVSYLEGPSARIISGCPNPDTKLFCWIHSTIESEKKFANSFRSIEEAKRCYQRFNKIIAVSEGIKAAFCKMLSMPVECVVYYNTVESDRILALSTENADEIEKADNKGIKLIFVGSLKPVKGIERLLRIIKRLVEEKYDVCLYILGVGPLQRNLETYIKCNGLERIVTLLGYQTNPYKYVAKSNLFICSSYSEGYSTAATEALIVGTPICTVNVSGMKEMLGANNEYGLITDNNEEALYMGIKQLLDNPQLLEYYKCQAKLRGISFNTEHTVKAVEDMLLNL